MASITEFRGGRVAIRYPSCHSGGGDFEPILNAMNMLSALAPASVPIDPLEPGNTVKAQAALLVAAKVLDTQRAVGEQVLQLLDPNVGRSLNRSA